MMKKSCILSIIACILTLQAFEGNPLFSQDPETGPKTSHRHSLSASFGFTFIPLAGELGTSQAKGLFVPSVGADYMLGIGKKWGIGAQANYELVHYMIIDKQVERDHALQLIALGWYEILNHWSVFAGGGIEAEPHQNIGLIRMGTEYEIILGERWFLSPEFYWDFKENYNTWSMELALGFSF